MPKKLKSKKIRIERRKESDDKSKNKKIKREGNEIVTRNKQQYKKDNRKNY